MVEYNKEVYEYYDDEGKKKTGPNCVLCKNFKITWNKKFPRACIVFGFKGKVMPSVTVFKVTGKRCPAFEPKNRTDSDKKR